MQELLTNAGLTESQASAYLYLLENGESFPPSLSKSLAITRSNAYKVLDSLEELGLASKYEVSKKFVYRPADPSALAELVAQKRNSVIALEQHVNAAMQELRSTYQKSSGNTTSAQVVEGKDAIIEAYQQQANLRQPIYFVKSRVDIPFMGFETMDQARNLSAKHATPRFGITPDGKEGSAVPEIDARTNLTRTWIDSEAYTSPVEWSVSGDELSIHVFEANGRVVRLVDYEIAESFRQLWKLMDRSLRDNPNYKKLPKRAARTI